MTTPAIETSGLTKSFGDHVVLTTSSLGPRQGRIVITILPALADDWTNRLNS